jgi:hypothetical protein
MSIIHEIVERLGGHIEKRRPSVPNVAQEQTLAAISAAFFRDSERQKFEHDLKRAGGPKILSNDAGLGRDGNESFLGRLIDRWLHDR